MRRSSPSAGLLIGLLITLAAVVTDAWYMTRQISGLQTLQTELADRNRKDSLQLLRIQNDLNSLALAMRDIIPWWLVWILLARELFILCLGPILQRHRLPLPPVSFIGKSATFNLIYAFPLVLLGEQAGAVGDVARPLGWAFVWWGTALYWVAGIMYAVQVRQMVRDSRDAPQSARS